MDNSDVNAILKGQKFNNQMMLVTAGFAGRDALRSKINPVLQEAIEDFKDRIFGEIIVPNLSFIDRALLLFGIQNYALRNCLLQLDEYDRVIVYYKGKKIGMTRFLYKEREMNKMELEAIFNDAAEQGLDVCVEITIPGQNQTEYVITKYKNLSNKLNYYMKNYDNELNHNKHKGEKIVDAMPIQFIFGNEPEKNGE
jgi:hypothetical protein